MAGQGAIIAVGAMDYPAEYRGVPAETIVSLGIGKVMSVTCTYDHRIIQGAESGMFLGKLQSLLDGEDRFLRRNFRGPEGPLRPSNGKAIRRRAGRGGGTSADVVKEAAVIQLINAYRVRGHLMAELDPLGGEPSYNAELDPLTYGLTIWDLDRHFFVGTLQHAFGTRRQVTAARDGRTAARHLLRQDRRGIHVHSAPRGEGLAAASRWRRRPASGRIRRRERLRILEDLLRAEEFEHFLDRRFIGQKRFSLEGAETAIAILSDLANRAADNGVR